MTPETVSRGETVRVGRSEHHLNFILSPKKSGIIFMYLRKAVFKRGTYLKILP